MQSLQLLNGGMVLSGGFDHVATPSAVNTLPSIAVVGLQMQGKPAVLVTCWLATANQV